jgi:hypothetical protein
MLADWQWPACNSPNNSTGRRRLALACTQLAIGIWPSRRVGVRGQAGAGGTNSNSPHLLCRRPSRRGGLSFLGATVSFDKEVFFKKQIEECRELEGRAINAEDWHFGGKLLGDGKRLRQAQTEARNSPQQHVVRRPSEGARHRDQPELLLRPAAL